MTLSPAPQKRRQFPLWANPADIALFAISAAAVADSPSLPKPIAKTTSSTVVAVDDAMIFSDFYKGSRSPLARLRSTNPQLQANKLPTASPDWVADEYADLLSKDKSKQKEAVRRYLAEKVRYDWHFDWPAQHPADSSLAKPSTDGSQRPYTVNGDAPATIEPTDDGYQVDNSDIDNSDAESIYSIVSQDNQHYRPRAEWTSDLDDGDDTSSFEDSGSSLHLAVLARRAKRRRAIRQEITWNAGLACFEARRDAWTGAKTVRVRSKPTATTLPQSISPRSPRRFFFRRSMSNSPPTATAALAAANAAAAPTDLSGTASDGSSIARDERDLRKIDSNPDGSTATTPPTSPEETRTYPVETLLPLAQPLLPPSNPLRASITPSVYLSLYDKVILHNLQPSCPINLSDMLRSCVSGWKRDGEWPPRAAPYNPPAPKKKAPKSKKPTTAPTTSATQTTEVDTKAPRRMSFSLLNRDNDESRAGKGFRRSLQRALGMGVIPGLGENA